MIESGDKYVDRLWCGCLHYLRNLIMIIDTGRVKAIGPGFSLSGESFESRVQWIGIAD